MCQTLGSIKRDLALWRSNACSFSPLCLLNSQSPFPTLQKAYFLFIVMMHCSRMWKSSQATKKQFKIFVLRTRMTLRMVASQIITNPLLSRKLKEGLMKLFADGSLKRILMIDHYDTGLRKSSKNSMPSSQQSLHLPST